MLSCEGFFAQVKRRVNKIVSEVCAWSLGHAASGKGPDVGFYGEAFPSNTWRYQMRGQELSSGFRSLNYIESYCFCKPHQISYQVVFQDFLLCMGKHLRAAYFCWKSDLKARHEAHNFVRWYQCTKLRILSNNPFSFPPKRFGKNNIFICRSPLGQQKAMRSLFC